MRNIIAPNGDTRKVIMTEQNFLGSYKLDEIYTGDAKELSKHIPDESVDLIFTDPVYQNIDDYRWLAETAARVLKPDSACLVWCGIGFIPETIDALRLGGLKYRWTCGSVIWGRNNRGDYGLYNKWACLLWFDKGRSKPSGWAFDIHQTSTSNKSGDGHAWQKHPAAIAQYLRILPGLVFDPFTGGGTVPAVCKMLGRHYLAFEIDPETAERARARVRNTQPPLFTLAPQQAELWEG